MDNKRVELPLYFLYLLELYKTCLSKYKEGRGVGAGRKGKILEVAYPHTCTHWLLLSAINIFPFVDAATP